MFGVVLSFWDERGATNRNFLEEIDDYFPKKLFSSKVRRDIAVSRAVLQGKPVFEIDPGSRAAQDYETLTQEFLERAKKNFPLKENKLEALLKEKIGK